MNYTEKYNLWVNSKIIDAKTKEEINAIKDEKELEERFYKELEFGTGGLRGIIGVGSNRMNIYTVGKATQGLADYLVNTYGAKKASVSVAYDSRNMATEFSETVTRVLTGNGIKVNLFQSLRPTPVLSFAVRELKSKAGIVVTASHNPKQYSGYKVYGEDGGQVTDESAAEILAYIEKVDDFSKIKTLDLEAAKEKGLLKIIGEEVDKVYIEKVKALTLRKELVENNAKNLKIIYTPIHGSGNIPVRRVLKELGYENLSVVKKQELPDGNFPTAPFPNPEVPQVFEIALEMAKDIQPDIIFGTDPDCDRIGVVVKDSQSEYKTLSGNQTGVLLLDYIISSMKELKILPSNAAVIKTIVTTEMATSIAKYYGVELIDVLTGFKYIGEKIKEFEVSKMSTYIFGFEESYGYLAGTFVRDKDAVIAATLICEMTLYYKTKGMSLYDALIKLFDKFGYNREGLVSMEFDGKAGQEKMAETMENLRYSKVSTIGTVKITKKMDYKLSIEKDLIQATEKEIKLPKSNVLKFLLEDGSWFVVRPSGTEPKMKVYFSVAGSSLKDSEEKLEVFKKDIMLAIN